MPSIKPAQQARRQSLRTEDILEGRMVAKVKRVVKVKVKVTVKGKAKEFALHGATRAVVLEESTVDSTMATHNSRPLRNGPALKLRPKPKLRPRPKLKLLPLGRPKLMLQQQRQLKPKAKAITSRDFADIFEIQRSTVHVRNRIVASATSEGTSMTSSNT